MKVLKAGTRVTTVIGGIEAMVVGVCITMDSIEYKVRYFTNGEEKVSWLHPFEIEVSPIRQQAGFGKKIETPDNQEIILIEC